MITFSPQAEGLVLALGAHADDIEIAAGGTLHLLAAAYPNLQFRMLVASANEVRRDECLESARLLLGDRVTVEVGAFRDGFLPYDNPSAVKEWLRDSGGEPALVFSPWQQDSHQDHRLVGALAWQIFRGITILEYEVLKWEAEDFVPNLYVPLTPDHAHHKLAHLAATFPSQHDKPWYDRSVFESVLLRRGVEHGHTRYAEAFVARKLALKPESSREFPQ